MSDRIAALQLFLSVFSGDLEKVLVAFLVTESVANLARCCSALKHVIKWVQTVEFNVGVPDKTVETVAQLPFLKKFVWSEAESFALCRDVEMDGAFPALVELDLRNYDSYDNSNWATRNLGEAFSRSTCANYLEIFRAGGGSTWLQVKSAAKIIDECISLHTLELCDFDADDYDNFDFRGFDPPEDPSLPNVSILCDASRLRDVSLILGGKGESMARLMRTLR